MFTIHLFTKPAYMLSAEENITAEHIKNLRQEINDNLDAAEEAITVLTKAGFKNIVLKYDIEFWRGDIHTDEQAIEEVKRLGLNTGLFDFGFTASESVNCDECGTEICTNCGQSVEDEENSNPFIETEWEFDKDEDNDFWLN